MSAPPLWSKLWHTACLEMADNPGFTLRERVVYLAYGSAKPNGHANFDKGEIQKKLGVDRRRVTEAIKRAIDLKQLDGESCDRCLVVPANLITSGLPGAYKSCKVHPDKSTVVSLDRWVNPNFRADNKENQRGEWITAGQGA